MAILTSCVYLPLSYPAIRGSSNPPPINVVLPAAAAFRRAGDRAFALGAAASALSAYRSAGDLERDELTHAELLLKAGRAAGREGAR